VNCQAEDSLSTNKRNITAETAEEIRRERGEDGIFLKADPMPRRSSINNQKSRINNDVLVVADRLHSAAIHLLRRLRKQDVATGEGPARLSALSVLVFGGPKTLGELAAAEQVKPPTMSRMVAGLARDKLVEIASDSSDARRMHIRATEKGKAILQEGRERRIQYLAAHLELLTSAELKALGHAVEILGRVLCDWH